jgi:hypothetical protein
MICARCGEEFMFLDLRLQMPGQPDRHYVVCPRDRWERAPEGPAF